MADLPTNYLDDILAQSMNGKRKFRITRPDGTFEEVIIEDISEYSQTGSTFGAGDINRTNQAVNEKFDSEDVVDPMLTTEPGFAADAYKTKLQFDEQNKNLLISTKTLIVNETIPKSNDTTWRSLSGTFPMTFKKYLIDVGIQGSMHNSLLIDKSMLSMLGSGNVAQVSAIWTSSNAGNVAVFNGNWQCSAVTQNDTFEVKIYGFN